MSGTASFLSNRYRSALRALACLGAIWTLSSLSLSLGCARLPPGQNNLSGRRISVTIVFNGAINPNNLYYFLINKYGQGTSGAHGPIAILEPLSDQNGTTATGNGFATGSSPNPQTVNGIKDYGITDFIAYSSQAAFGLAQYHFTTDPNQQQWPPNPSQVLNAIRPTFSDLDANADRTLRFDMDMVSLVTDTNDMTAKIAEARQIRYLQINIVATNTISLTASTINGNKLVDAMGDGRNISEFSSFREIDLSQSRTFSSSETLGYLSPEPINDVYPDGPSDPSLDIKSWTVDVQPHS